MKKNVKKVILTVLSVALIVALSVTATLAWLQDTTEPVVNTFTEGKVDIDLYETKDGTKVMANSYKMVPGDVLAKDPTVEVLAVSEACWLFVKIDKSANYDTYLEVYEVAEGWTLLEGTTDVYYRAVASSNAQQDFNVLKDNKVFVKGTVTNEQMDAAEGDGKAPTLTFTAYAIQQAKFTNVKDAWTEVYTYGTVYAPAT